MIREESRKRNDVWVVGVLAVSLILAFAKPAFSYLTQRATAEELALTADYGIPTMRWVKVPVPPSELPAGSMVTAFKFVSIGLDYLNTDIYLRCAGPTRRIYEVDCPGDPLGRVFMYPPLMPYFFVWIPFFSMRTALGLWSLFILIGIFVSVWAVSVSVRRAASSAVVWPAALAALTVVSAPSMFEFERGNNNVWILLIYAGATLALVRGKVFWTGVCVSLAMMLKIYPIALWGACAIAAVAMIRVDRRRALEWLAGLAVGVAAVGIPLFSDYWHYVFVHFPTHNHYRVAGSAWDHSLKTAYGWPGFALGVVLWAVVLAAWCRSILRRDPVEGREQRSLLAFAFLAALCTYFIPSTESFDYNLITAFPLLVCLAYAEPRSHAALLTGGTVLWAAGVALPRWINFFLFGLPERTFSMFLVAEVAGLACIAIYLLLASFVGVSGGSKVGQKTRLHL